uniref:imm11 family protein n=1 Tax=Anaerobutyricum hallii TaxID=39488 RepID=UPI003FEEB4FD
VRRIWMKYYKLSMDMERENDIICHFQNDYGIQQNALNTGKVFENWDDRFEFFYTKEEGDVWTDYLANDKGWFLVSNRLKTLLESVNTDIQFLKVGIKETNNGEDFKQYYIANIIKVVDALCLDKSEYFETEIEGIGTIYTVSKYGIYADKTDSADVFKLSNRQEIPIFVSEKFKDLIQKVNITGISLTEISVV